MLKIIERLKQASEKEKSSWVPILMGIGVSIILFGLSSLNLQGLSNITAWITLACGIGMFSWGVRWSKYVETNTKEKHGQIEK